MPTNMKLWQVKGDAPPRPVDADRLNLESRLETWIQDDVSLISDDLLVIGKQVSTAYGGKIDLLALDSAANLVVLELKKGQTPREVVAQALDYASWVHFLEYDDVIDIASEHFGNRKAFEKAFKEKFDDDLPEVVNDRHRMYIVASSLDSSTERIIEYLSEVHRVDINAATFSYFKAENIEWLGRSMLLDEETVEVRAETGRRRSPTLDEFNAIAEENGVQNLWETAYEAFDSISQGRIRKRTSLLFRVRIDGTLRWILTLYPSNSSQAEGLTIRVHRNRISQYFNVSDEEISKVCGSDDGTNSFDSERLDSLIELLKKNVPQG